MAQPSTIDRKRVIFLSGMVSTIMAVLMLSLAFMPL